MTTSGYELRKIRHDYNDLSIGLKSLINSRKYDEVIPLLQKYDSEIISSFQILYNTGNDLTDAILSDKQKNADENIKITFEGSLANVPADNLEICVLFNNMIDIAFENVKKFCGNGKQIISLKAECQRKQYTEQNSGNTLHQKQRNRVIKPIQIAVSAQQLIGAQ